jgi:hypothetical protein
MKGHASVAPVMATGDAGTSLVTVSDRGDLLPQFELAVTLTLPDTNAPV